MFLWLFAALTGCWGIEDGNRALVRWEMHDHEADAAAARDAIAEDRMAAARDAGLRLAWPDPVPGIPENALVWLASVRGGAEALSRETDRSAAATRLLSVTADCAGCHRELGVEVPAGGAERAWTGLLFEDEPSWTTGLAALGSPAADTLEATSWSARRAAYAGWLVSGRPGAP